MVSGGVEMCRQVAAKNSSTVKSALAIKTRSVPRATCECRGTESVVREPGLVNMIWLACYLVTCQPSHWNAHTTSRGLRTGKGQH